MIILRTDWHGDGASSARIKNNDETMAHQSFTSGRVYSTYCRVGDYTRLA